MEYLIFEINFIALVKFLGTLEELKKLGYKKPGPAFYSGETELYEILEIWHLSLKGAPIFYKEYKIGHITYFGDKNRINLSKIKTNKKRYLIDQLFGWSWYGAI